MWTMNNPVTFRYNNKQYTVDTVNQPGLWRNNAMTWYQFVFPHIICAREIYPNNTNPGPTLFYLIYTREENWLQVDVNTGLNVVNIFNAPPTCNIFSG